MTTGCSATAPASVRGDLDRELCDALFDELRVATGDGVGITRESFGPGESRALDIVERAARTLGLATERDAGANLIVTLPGTQPDLPYIACGSHLDSVPQGGNFDGGAGVIAGLAVLAGMKRNGIAPRRTQHADYRDPINRCDGH